MENPMHTPGPWSVSRGRDCYANINAAGWTALASVVIRMNGENYNKIDGIFNARCIAAVPELVAACVAIANNCSNAQDLANEALAKIYDLL